MVYKIISARIIRYIPKTKTTVYAGLVVLLAACICTGCAAVSRTNTLKPGPLPAKDEAKLAFMAGQLADQRGELAQAIDYYQQALRQDPGSPVLRRHLLYSLVSARRFTEARAECHELIQLNPKDREAHCLLASLYAADGDTKTAESLYRTAIHLGRETPGPFTGLGILLLKQEKYPEAEIRLREALQIDPLDRKARRALVKHHQVRNENNLAIKLLKQALQHIPGDYEWMGSLAKIYEALKLEKKAVEIYLQLQQAYPDDEETRRFLSDYYLRRSEWEKAIEQLEKLLQLMPDDFLARRSLGLALYRLRRYDEARKQLDILFSNDRADAGAHYLMGSIYYYKGCNYLAIDELRLAIKMDGDVMEAYTGLAAALLRVGEKTEALDVLQDASIKFNTIPQVKIIYGLALLRTDEPQEALRAFAEARKMAPREAGVYFHMGRAYLQLNQFEQAISAWKKAVRLDPELADAYNYLGYTLAERGLQLKQAVRWIKKALELKPGNGYYLDSLGWAYYQQGKYQQALTHILAAQQALKKAGLSPETEIPDHLGDVYFKLQRFTEAEQAWRQALQADPGNTQIKNKLDKLPQARDNKKP